MASFNPTTIYASDWQYCDFVEDADYYISSAATTPAIQGIKVRREDITHPDFVGITAGLGVGSMPTAFAVWNPTDFAFEPRIGGRILTDDGVGWIIQSFEASRFGHWKIAAEREKVNAA